MPVHIDINRGREVAERLYQAFRTTGIHGRTDMPEDQPPCGVAEGSLEHVLFITLAVAIDYQRDANQVWDSARRTFEDDNTRYLFDPSALHDREFAQVKQDMQTYQLSKKPDRDAGIWRTIGVTLHMKWGGDPRRFLEACGWDAPTVLKRLKTDTHQDGGRKRPDFPNLRGDKIGPLWLRMLRNNVGIADLRGLKLVPIPVDINIARATLTTGVVRGAYAGRLQEVFSYIRRAWLESVRGLTAADGRPMIALDVDEPLWHLSKYGCTDRTESGHCEHLAQCEARKFCTGGQVIVQGDHVEVNT